MTLLNGFLVYFSDANSPDLAGEFFNAQTDFDLAGRKELSLYFEHGQDSAIGRRRIGRAAISEKSDGLWVNCKPVAELPPKIWERFVRLSRDGLLGFSSGAGSHLVETERRGNAHWIKRWPLFDASFTVSPCEPRCVAGVGEYAAQAPLIKRVAKLRSDYVEHLQAINETRIWQMERMERYAD